MDYSKIYTYEEGDNLIVEQHQRKYKQIRYQPPPKGDVLIVIVLLFISFGVYSVGSVFLRQQYMSVDYNTPEEGLEIVHIPTNFVDLNTLTNETIRNLPDTFCYEDQSCSEGVLLQIQVKLAEGTTAPNGTQVIIIASLDFKTWWVAGRSTAIQTITSSNQIMNVTRVCAAFPQFHYVVACLLPPYLTNRYSRQSPPMKDTHFNFCEKIGSMCAGVCVDDIDINHQYCNANNNTIQFDKLVADTQGKVTFREFYTSFMVNLTVYAFLKYILLLMVQLAPLLRWYGTPKPLGSPKRAGQMDATVISQAVNYSSERDIVILRSLISSLFAMHSVDENYSPHKSHLLLNFDCIVKGDHGKAVKARKKLTLVLNTLHEFKRARAEQNRDQKFSEFQRINEELCKLQSDELANNLRNEFKQFQKNHLYENGRYNFQDNYWTTLDNLISRNDVDFNEFSITSTKTHTIYEIDLGNSVCVSVFTYTATEFKKDPRKKKLLERILDKWQPRITCGKLPRPCPSPGKQYGLEKMRKYLLKKYVPKIWKKNIFFAIIDCRHSPTVEFYNLSLPFFFTKYERAGVVTHVRLENVRLHQQIQEYHVDRKNDSAQMECGSFMYETNPLRTLSSVVTSSGSQSIVHLGDRADGTEFKFAESIVEDLATSLVILFEEKSTYSSYCGVVYSLSKSPDNFIISAVRWSVGSVECLVRTLNPMNPNFKYLILTLMLIELYAIGMTLLSNYVHSFYYYTGMIFPIYFVFFVLACQYRKFQACLTLYMALTYPLVSCLSSFYWMIVMVVVLAMGIPVQMNAFTLIVMMIFTIGTTIACKMIIYRFQKQGFIDEVREHKMKAKAEAKSNREKDKIETTQIRDAYEKNRRILKSVAKNNDAKAKQGNIIEDSSLIPYDSSAAIEFEEEIIQVAEQATKRTKEKPKKLRNIHPIAGKCGDYIFEEFSFLNWMSGTFVGFFIILAGLKCFFDHPTWDMNYFSSIILFSITFNCIIYVICILAPILQTLYNVVVLGQSLATQFSVAWMGLVMASLCLFLLFPRLMDMWKVKKIVIGNTFVSTLVFIVSLLLFVFVFSSITFDLEATQIESSELLSYFQTVS